MGDRSRERVDLLKVNSDVRRILLPTPAGSKTDNLQATVILTIKVFEHIEFRGATGKVHGTWFSL